MNCQNRPSTATEEQRTAVPAWTLGNISLLVGAEWRKGFCVFSTWFCILIGFAPPRLVLSDGKHQPTVKFKTLSWCEILILRSRQKWCGTPTHQWPPPPPFSGISLWCPSCVAAANNLLEMSIQVSFIHTPDHHRRYLRALFSQSRSGPHSLLFAETWPFPPRASTCQRVSYFKQEGRQRNRDNRYLPTSRDSVRPSLLRKPSLQYL